MRRLLNRRSLRKEEENKANIILPVDDQLQDECSDFSLPGGEPPAILRIFSSTGPDMQGDDFSSIHDSVLEHQQPRLDTTNGTVDLDRLLAIPEDDEVSMMGESIKMGSKLKELNEPGSPKESPHLSDSGLMYQGDGHTDSTTIPSGNKQIPENFLSSFVYVSLLIPPTTTSSPINGEFGEPFASGNVPKNLPPPNKVIERSIHEHLLLLFQAEEENAPPFETKRSLPVRVDDHSLLVCHDENVLNVVDSVVLSHLKKQDFSQALETYESLLHDLRRMETNPMLITPLLYRLSIVSLLAGQTMKALHFSAQILERSQTDPALQLIARIQMGLTYFGLGDMSKALISWREASYKVGANYAAAAMLWNNIACLQYYTGDVKTAESFLKQSIALQKELQRVPKQFRRDLLNTATTLSNLAILEARQSLYVDAVSHMEESLLLHESVLDHGSDAIIATMQFLKSLDDRQKEDFTTTRSVFVPGTSQPLVDAAADSPPFLDPPVVFDEGFSLPKARKEHAPMVDYIDMGSVVHQLGLCQLVRDTIIDNFCAFTQENLSFVHDTQTKRLSIPIDVDGNEVIDAELYLPHIYIQAREHLEKNEIGDALELLKGTLASLRKKYGTLHPLVAATLHNLGMVMLFCDKYTAAFAYFQHAVSIRSATLGFEHPDVAISLTKMGLLQLAKKDFDTAIMIFSQVLRARRKNLGYHHPEVAKTLSNIACVHFECGGLLPASKALEESIEILRNATDGGSLEPALATVLSNFGFVLAKRRMFNDATRVYEEALGLRVQHCVFASIAETRENLAYARASSSISTSKPRGDGTCVDISKMMEPLLDNLQCS